MENEIKDIAVKIAKESVENFVKYGKVIESEAAPVSQLDADSSGVFVTIKTFGDLRGCIGTVSPTGNSIKKDIILNAVSAASRDPRFSPVSIDELVHLAYSVDVLQTPFPVSGVSALNPKSLGIIVRKTSRQGVLLPDIEGIDNARQQLAIACRKAGISLTDDPEIFAFEVIRYGEK